MGGRTYNPETLQFLQEDSYLGDITDILSLNQYAYCKGNPLRYIDPTGHSAEESQDGLSLLFSVLNNIFSFLDSLFNLGDNPVAPVNSKVQNEIQSQIKHLTAKMPSNFLDKLQEALNPSDSAIKGSGLIVGMSAVLIAATAVTNPIAASMLLSAGMSVSLQVITDCIEGNKTSISSLVTSAAVGAASGAVAGVTVAATEISHCCFSVGTYCVIVKTKGTPQGCAFRFGVPEGIQDCCAIRGLSPKAPPLVPISPPLATKQFPELFCLTLSPAGSNPIKFKKSKPHLWFALFGVPEGIRTPGLSLRRRTLYPTELLRHFSVPINYNI